MLRVIMLNGRFSMYGSPIARGMFSRVEWFVRSSIGTVNTLFMSDVHLKNQNIIDVMHLPRVGLITTNRLGPIKVRVNPERFC